MILVPETIYTRKVAIYINGKEVEASVIFGFFVFSPLQNHRR